MATVTFFPKSILQEKESLYLGTHEHLEGEGVGSLIILKDEKKTKQQQQKLGKDNPKQSQLIVV